MSKVDPERLVAAHVAQGKHGRIVCLGPGAAEASEEIYGALDLAYGMSQTTVVGLDG